VAEVSIRDLRNHGGDVIDRVASGERITVTRSGKPVAELRPLRSAVPAEVLIQRRHHLPAVDPRALRADIDALVDGTL
jgi:prevent-host-death family protein